jgi:hypothetical protein
MLSLAVAAYEAERPVVVLDEEEHALHGEEFMKSISALDMPMQTAVFRSVPRSYFEASDWPETLEAARQVFFLKNPDFGKPR